MVFGRKKNTTAPSSSAPGMRGRDNVDQKAQNSSASGSNPLARRFQLDEEPETTDLNQPADHHEPADDEPGEATTRVLADSGIDEDIREVPAPEDPLSGFLVVIEGPGRGEVCKLGYGIHSVGRDPAQQVSLDYGDLRISRQCHCQLTFDPASGKFWIQAGQGRALTYLDDQPVLSPLELVKGSHIRLGGTVLRFVPFCGPGFSWENNQSR